MPRRKSEVPLDRKAMNFVDGDYEAMGALFPTMGAAVAIRMLVHNYVKRVRASLEPVDLTLPEADLKELMHDE